MLGHYVFLLCALIQVLVSGSDTGEPTDGDTKPGLATTPEPESEPDHPLCLHVDIEECRGTTIMTYCSNLCSLKDHEICSHIQANRCQEEVVMAGCPGKCRTPAIVTECPSPWFSIGSQCFRLVQEPSEKRTWAGARTYCSELNKTVKADLAEPNRLKDLTDKLVNDGFDGTLFLGGSDHASKADWRWNNGGGAITSGWRPGQPKHKKNSGNCLYMWPGTGANSFYNGPCDLPQPFLCERH